MLDTLPIELIALILGYAVRLDPMLCRFLFEICKPFADACKHINTASLSTCWLDPVKPFSFSLNEFISKYGKVTRIYFTRTNGSDYRLLKLIPDCPTHIGISEYSGVGPKRLKLKKA